MKEQIRWKGWTCLGGLLSIALLAACGEADPQGCSVATDADGTRTITCDDGTSATIEDGQAGSSCTVEDNEDGTKTISCEDGMTVTIEDGEEGPQGPQGPQGEPGDVGADGTTALVRLDEEPVGENCRAGGVEVNSGLDADDNGSLEDTEIDQTSYVCNYHPCGEGEVLDAAGGCVAGIELVVEGSVVVVDDWQNALPQISTGDACSATLKYDPNQTSNGGNVNNAKYYSTSEPYGLYSSFGSYTFDNLTTANTLELWLTNDYGDDSNDWFRATSYTDVSGIQDTVVIRLLLEDEEGTVFTGTSIPEQLPALSEFETTTLSLVATDFGAVAMPGPRTVVECTVSSVTRIN